MNAKVFSKIQMVYRKKTQLDKLKSKLLISVSLKTS